MENYSISARSEPTAGWQIALAFLLCERLSLNSQVFLLVDLMKVSHFAVPACWYLIFRVAKHDGHDTVSDGGTHACVFQTLKSANVDMLSDGRSSMSIEVKCASVFAWTMYNSQVLLIYLAMAVNQQNTQLVLDLLEQLLSSRESIETSIFIRKTGITSCTPDIPTLRTTAERRWTCISMMKQDISKLLLSDRPALRNIRVCTRVAQVLYSVYTLVCPLDQGEILKALSLLV